MDLNETLIDGRFKDAKPLATVEKIRALLRDNGIEIEEFWNERTVPHCHSLRLRVKGTTFGTNGKGLTPEFTLASAYGEMIERLQLGIVNIAQMQKMCLTPEPGKQDVLMPMEDLLRKHPQWYRSLSDQLLRYTSVTMTPRQILSQYADKTGMLRTTPHYDLITGETVYYPLDLRVACYGSNGCAAGNTMEEAIVQATSEIIERANKMKILTEGLTPPEVPEEVLKTFPVAWEIITWLRDHGLRLSVRDCSLGMRFPVICVCYIDEATGRYHTHFGAYPIFEIALERALTESFQGRTLQGIGTLEGFLYRKDEVFSIANVSNEFKEGVSQRTPEFFIGEPSLPWNEQVGYSGQNNRELLHQIVADLAARGLHPIVRDGSCLGFPTCHVLIPGFSECLIHRLDLRQNDFRYAPHAEKVLQNPSAASVPDMLGLVMHLDRMGTLSQTVATVRGFTLNARLFARVDAREDQFLMSATMGYVYHRLGRKDQILPCVERMLRCCPAELTGELLCLKRWLSMGRNGYDEATTRKLLTAFHRAETVDELYACLAQDRSPLEKYTLHCDKTSCDGCRLKDRCGHQQIEAMLRLIRERTERLDHTAFADALKTIMEDTNQ